MKAEHASEPYRHVGICRKIKVYLKRIRYRTDPCDGSGQHVAAHGKDVVRYLTHSVCEKHLLAEADEKAHKTVRKIGKGMLSVRYLVLNGRISYDRSRNELRKERDVQRDIQGIFLNSRISAVYVNDIADALKREK